MEIIKYNPKTGEWKMRVQHFTKYGGIMEEEDSMAGDEQSQSEPESVQSRKISPVIQEEKDNETDPQWKKRKYPYNAKPKQFSHFSDF